MDAYLDPTTGAYVADAAGLLRDPANGLANAVYLRLMTPLGSYWAAPLIGSRLHELARSKAVSNKALVAKQYASLALADLIRDGRAKSIDVEAVQQAMADGSKAVAMAVRVVDAAGRENVFKHHIPVA